MKTPGVDDDLLGEQKNAHFRAARCDVYLHSLIWGMAGGDRRRNSEPVVMCVEKTLRDCAVVS